MPQNIFKTYVLIAIFVIWSLVLAAKFAPPDVNFTFAYAAYILAFLATASLAVIKYINEDTIKLSLDMTMLFAVTSTPISLWLLGYFYEQLVGPFFRQ